MKMHVELLNVLVIYLTFQYVEGLQIKAVCYSPSCTSHTLQCKEGRVIAINEAFFGVRDSSRDAECGSADPCTSDSCCQYLKAGEIDNGSFDNDTLQLAQRACVNKQTCTIDIPYNPSWNYDFIYYEYECHPASRVLNMMCHDSVTSTYETSMFYDGKDRNDSLNIDCSCTITSVSNTTVIAAYTQYIHLEPSTCNSFSDTISTLKMPNCTSTGLQEKYDFLSNLNSPIHMSVRNLSANPNDIYWVRFTNKDASQTSMSVECSGCGVPIAGACGRTTHETNDCYGGLGCSKFDLKCKKDQKLALTSRMFLGHNPALPICEKGDCNAGKEPTCCRYALRDSFERFQGDELEKLYQDCTFKESCVAAPQIVNPGNHTYGYYVYECIPDSSVVEMTTGGSVTGFEEVFISYDGSKRSENTTLDCTCTITSPATMISIKVYYVTLHQDSCCHVNVSSPGLDLPDSCLNNSGAGVFSAVGSVASTPFTVQLMSMITSSTDKIIMRFNSGQGIDLDCSNCTEQNATDNNVCVYPKVSNSSEKITDEVMSSNNSEVSNSSEKITDEEMYSNNSGISGGGIAGIVIGCLVIILVIIVVVIVVRRRSNGLSSPDLTTSDTGNNDRNIDYQNTISYVNHIPSDNTDLTIATPQNTYDRLDFTESENDISRHIYSS